MSGLPEPYKRQMIAVEVLDQITTAENNSELSPKTNTPNKKVPKNKIVQNRKMTPVAHPSVPPERYAVYPLRDHGNIW
jgi:hypothetical protein